MQIVELNRPEAHYRLRKNEDVIPPRMDLNEFKSRAHEIRPSLEKGGRMDGHRPGRRERPRRFHWPDP